MSASIGVEASVYSCVCIFTYVRVYIFAASLGECVCVCVRVWVCESVSVWVCALAYGCVSSCSFWRGECLYKRKEGRSYRLGDFIFCFFPFFCKKEIKRSESLSLKSEQLRMKNNFFPKPCTYLNSRGIDARCTRYFYLLLVMLEQHFRVQSIPTSLRLWKEKKTILIFSWDWTQVLYKQSHKPLNK